MATVTVSEGQVAERLAAEVGALERSIASGLELAGGYEALALQLGLPEIDLVELPPVVGPEVDQALLRGVPPLYLAAELEAAGLLAAADVVAGLYVSGALRIEAPASGERLLGHWRSRHQRFSEEERGAYFSRVFGLGDGPALAGRRPVNVEFESLMIGCTQALDRFGGTGGAAPAPAAEAALRLAASQLAENLARHATGIPAAAARELLTALDGALDVFKDPELWPALGAHGVWSSVAAASRRYLETDPDVPAHVERGRCGQTVLAWLAEAAPGLDGPLDPRRAVVAAAGTWLQVTLGLQERESAAVRLRR